LSIDNEILKFIEELKYKHNIMPYAYLNDKTFEPGKSFVLYSSPYWDYNELISGIKSLLAGKWLVGGSDTHLFETKFAKKIGDKYAVFLNSGSSANLIMINALKIYYDWPDGSEILVSPVAFPTTISVIYQNNLIPVFIDSEKSTYNIDLNLIEEKITNKTKAIFLSPVLGNSPDLDFILEICVSHDIKLILDGCDSLGSLWRYNNLNQYAVATSESFYPAHTISTIQGGMISSSNEEIILIARRLATWGRGCHCQSTQNLLPLGACGERFNNWLAPKYCETVDHRYTFTEIGFNLIPPELLGSIGLKQLDKLDEILDKRKCNHKIISELFMRYIKNIHLPEELEHSDTAWFGNFIICDNKELKQKLVAYLENSKIQTRSLFSGNLLLHPAYSFLDDHKKYPVANTVLDLTFFTGNPPHYGPNILNYVEDMLRKFDNE